MEACKNRHWLVERILVKEVAEDPNPQKKNQENITNSWTIVVCEVMSCVAEICRR